MKHFILPSVLLGVLSVVSDLRAQTVETQLTAPVQQVGVQYGYRRPYSFYYPYNYQFYTPHVQNYRQSSSMACHWVYINGTYIYICD
jgi:hypothetical protein